MADCSRVALAKLDARLRLVRPVSSTRGVAIENELLKRSLSSPSNFLCCATFPCMAETTL